jgi:hypothetical protein
VALPVRPDALERPHPSRFNPDRPGYEAALRAHAVAVAAREPGYLDPATGLFVLTAAWLVARGTCCDQGCRHCPYVGVTSPGPDSGP